jgi:hypothetical protein
MTDSGKYWFPAKRYGWGWGPPTSWHGWLVVICWCIAFFVGAVRFRPRHFTLFWFGAAMVILLLAICYLKGEPPKWRWGDAKK